MEYEDVPTDTLIRYYNQFLAELIKCRPGSAAANLRAADLKEVQNELRNRERALGVVKKAPLTGRKHSRQVFPTKL